MHDEHATDTLPRQERRNEPNYGAGGPQTHFAPDYGEAKAVDSDRRGQGVKDIIGGAVLICIGLLFGGSVFLGTADAIDWVFDGLGTFWVAKGIYLTVTA